MKWKIKDEGPIYSVEWCPDKEKSIFAVASYVPTPSSRISLAWLTEFFSLAALRKFTSSLLSPYFPTLSPHEHPLLLSTVSTLYQQMTKETSEPSLNRKKSFGVNRKETLNEKRDDWSKLMYREHSSKLHGTREEITFRLFLHQVGCPFSGFISIEPDADSRSRLLQLALVRFSFINCRSIKPKHHSAR
jgi:hypothetical protein